MSTLPPEEERFAKNVNVLVTLLHENIINLNKRGYDTVNPALVGIAAAVIQAMNKHYLIKGFIEKSHHECWDAIHRHDEDFFMSHAGDVFSFLPVDHVNIFIELFRTVDQNGYSVISQDVKDQFWELFEALVKISIKYIHKNREPYSTATPEGLINTYRTNFMDNIDIQRHSSKWKVRLEFPMNI